MDIEKGLPQVLQSVEQVGGSGQTGVGRVVHEPQQSREEARQLSSFWVSEHKI